MHRTPGIQAAEIVLPGDELVETLAFFTDQLGFRIETIYPADGPRVAVVSGFGLRLRLERGADAPAGRLRLICEEPATFPDGTTRMSAPNGTRVELVVPSSIVDLPPLQPSFVLSRLKGADWGIGRAGMRYRDLIPDRQGGRFIASHIHIADGGPVPDYPHFHKIRFQMIYCYKGWVEVVYEDQGESFVMYPGDCVLQPPEIRHQVLQCSPGLEVIELGCPAEHETWADHDTVLPTSTLHPDRDFTGQRFSRHQASCGQWRVGHMAGVEIRDTGIGAASNGVAEVRVARFSQRAQPQPMSHDGELSFSFVLQGLATLCCRGSSPKRLSASDCFVVPAGMDYQLEQCSDDLQLLQVMLPASR